MKVGEIVTYSEIIKDRRTTMCLSQADLADVLGFGSSYRSNVCKWENGTHRPTYRTARKLAEVLGGEPSDYRLGSEDKE